MRKSSTPIFANSKCKSKTRLRKLKANAQNGAIPLSTAEMKIKVFESLHSEDSDNHDIDKSDKLSKISHHSKQSQPLKVKSEYGTRGHTDSASKFRATNLNMAKLISANRPNNFELESNFR